MAKKPKIQTERAEPNKLLNDFMTQNNITIVIPDPTIYVDVDRTVKITKPIANAFYKDELPNKKEDKELLN